MTSADDAVEGLLTAGGEVEVNQFPPVQFVTPFNDRQVEDA